MVQIMDSPTSLALQERLHIQINELDPLLELIKTASSLAEKKQILLNWIAINKKEVAENLNSYLQQLPLQSQVLIFSLTAIDQAPLLFRGFQCTEDSHHSVEIMLDRLLEVEIFYESLGGIIGYHLTFLKLLVKKQQKKEIQSRRNYLHPAGLDLTADSAEVRLAIRLGVENLPRLAVLYPVGGAGDRLNLSDEKTGVQLPVAELPFTGRSLLEGMVRDLQALEYLFYKVTGLQDTTPIALMTSQEKNNDAHIRAICEREKWFGRPKESFKFFEQPLSPVITEEGNWALSEPFKLILKPGGHGVLWKLAEEKGVWHWFKSHDRLQAIIRQINNPVAGTDQGILPLIGIGCSEEKTFGFASCPRLPKAAEGMDILIERQQENGFTYSLTNIEYTEFESEGIEDRAVSSTNPFSPYPANTNILFVDLEKIQRAVQVLPIPGMLINMKSKMSCFDRQGAVKETFAGRLESTMQNIADALIDHFPKRLELEEQKTNLQTFITYNSRPKTLSVTKSCYKPGQSILGTPEGCFFEMMRNSYDLLKNYCGLQLSTFQSEEDYLAQGPSLLFSYHPALGPLYTIIAQKIRGGKLEKNAELQLEIAEVEIINLHLNGSLRIKANDLLGERQLSGITVYSSQNGKCILRNVTVINQGIDRTASPIYWKNQLQRIEEVTITLQGSAEFIAENVVFLKSYEIVVPDGVRMIAYQEGNAVVFKQEKIAKATWEWKYTFDKNDRIQVNR